MSDKAKRHVESLRHINRISQYDIEDHQFEIMGYSPQRTYKLMQSFANAETKSLKEENTTLKETLESTINHKNPYNREKQYQLYIGFENALDSLIRTKKVQEFLQQNNQKQG